MKCSVLDQSPSSAGSPQAVCDALGYERFWVSQHHNSASIVGTAPEILMAAIAACTRRIRVGSAIAPARIDLGVGRAPGSDGLTAHALNPHSNAAEELPRQVQELEYWLSNRPLPADAFGLDAAAA